MTYDSTSTADGQAAQLEGSVSRFRKIKKALIAGEKPWLLYIGFLILLIVFSVASPYFLSANNFMNIGRQTALVSIIAVGMTFVIVSGQIDLSVGSTLALAGMTAALAMQYVGNVWIIGALAGLATGAFVGLVNGVIITKLKIPSFLVTLGTLSAVRGVALMLTDTKPVIIDNEAYFAVFGEGSLLGIPSPIIWTALSIIGGILLLHFNVYGRCVYATGGNATAARYSGIDTQRTTTIAFVITGILSGLAALVLTARSHAARPDAVEGIELDVIAAVILGGSSLFGGRGQILGTLLGSLIIGTLNNGLVLLGVGSSLQLVIKGAIIVAAVAFTRK